MLKRIAAVLCLASLMYAKTPRPLANVPLHTPDLKTIDLKKFRGKAVALVIFSMECKECQAVLDLMSKIQTELGPQGLQVVGAAGDDKAKFMLGAFVARYRPTFPIGYLSTDEIKKIADVAPGVRPVAPILMFIDRWGTVRYEYYGDNAIFKDAQRSIRSLSLGVIKANPYKDTPKVTTPPPQN